MDQFNRALHPISLILPWALQNDTAVFEFGEYIYTPQTVAEERRLLTVPARQISVDWLECKLLSLAPGWELALHSRVRIDRSVFHIPMIDFANWNTEADRVLQVVLPPMIKRKLHVFDSGRGHHAYSTELIDEKDWVRFMGRLLLCNLPNKPAIVDGRWIGHRLISGYGALRWSCNSKNYIKYPTLVTSGVIAQL